MKKLIALASASVVVVSLAGCSATTPPTDPADVSGEITYNFWDPNYESTADAMIAAFNEEYPDVTVTPIVTPYAQYWTTLKTQASSNTLPDVFWMNMPYFKLYASNGQLAPIDDLVESGAIDPSKYPESITEFYALDGVRYAVPKDVDTNAMWVNTKLFEEAGVPLPDEDWSYDDYRETAKQIQDALGDQGVYGTAFYTAGQTTWYSSIFAYEGEVITADGTKSGWDEPGTLKGLQVWADILADGSSPSVQQLTETTADQWFLNGKAAMFPSIAGASVALIGTAPNAADYKAVPLPQGTRPATVAHALSNVVSAKSKNLAAAQAFQAFLASEDAQLIQAEGGVTISAYEGTADAFAASYPGLDLQVFVDAIPHGYPYPASINTDEWAGDEFTLIVPALAGASSLEDALAELAVKTDAVLAAER
jgi:multiple sugar transport system substrate-binding protein